MCQKQKVKCEIQVRECKCDENGSLGSPLVSPKLQKQDRKANLDNANGRCEWKTDIIHETKAIRTVAICLGLGGLLPQVPLTSS